MINSLSPFLVDDRAFLHRGMSPVVEAVCMGSTLVSYAWRCRRDHYLTKEKLGF